MIEIRIARIDISAHTVQQVTDRVAQEKPFYIFLNRKHYVTIFCTPSNLKELAVGHLLTEGLLKSAEEIETVTLKEKEGICRIILRNDIDAEKRLSLSKHLSRVIFSACGARGPYQPSRRLAKIRSEIRMSGATVSDCIRQLNLVAETYRETGGVHAAAIYRKDGTLLTSAEDVGRHNAVDKVIGNEALKKTDLGSCLLGSTGRLTGDIVIKAARVRIPIVASLAAAVDSGIMIARDVNLTLIGFVRGRRMNLYSCDERIVP